MPKLVTPDELGDIDLVKGSNDVEALPPRRPTGLVLVAVLVVAILALGAVYLYMRRGAAEPAQSAAAPSAESVKVRTDPAETIPLPPLADTDPLIRQLVGGLSSHPVVAAWLTTDRLIVNFVTVTSRIAAGETPVAELKAVGPVPPFRVRTSQGVPVIDQASYARYDRYADAVAALDAGGTARLYETVKPRVNEADRGFGGTGEFDAELERAIVELLKVPVVEGDIPLKPHGIGYAYADPRLEQLSAAQKQLLRMGPRNVRLIQGKLREIAVLLSIPESRLPTLGS